MLISWMPPRNSTATRIHRVVDAVSASSEGEHEHGHARQAADGGGEGADIGGDVERHVGEGGERLEGEPEERGVRGAAAGLASRAAILDGHLLEADPGDHPAKEAAALRHAPDRVGHAPGHQPEVAGLALVRHAREASHHRVEAGGEQALDPALVAADAAREHHVGLLVARELQHVRDELRRVLEVGVHQHHVRAAWRGRGPRTSRSPCRSCARAEPGPRCPRSGPSAR